MCDNLPHNILNHDSFHSDLFKAVGESRGCEGVDVRSRVSGTSLGTCIYRLDCRTARSCSLCQFHHPASSTEEGFINTDQRYLKDDKHITNDDGTTAVRAWEGGNGVLSAKHWDQGLE